MSTKIGSIFGDLGLRTVAFDKGITQANKKLAAFSKNAQAAGKKMSKIGAGVTAGLTAPIGALFTKSLTNFGKQEKAIAQTKAALKSMGDVSGKTFDELADQASRLQENSIFGDEEILTKVTSNLLTFGNVAGEEFDRAQQSALDMSAALGQDLQSSTIMLGKALNDPVAGISAMSRVGVSFTEQQKEQIKAMAEVGDVAGAQQLMLAELEKQYGGQAKAIAELDSSQPARMWNSIGDAMERVGAVIAPVVADISNKVKELAETFSALSPQAQKIIVIGLAIAATLGPVIMGLGMFIMSVGALAPALALLVSPIGLVVAGVAALGAGAIYLYTHWDTLTQKFPALTKAANAVGSAIGYIKDQFGTFLNIGKSAVEGISALFKGDFKGAFGSAKEVVSGFRETFLADMVKAGRDAVVGLVRAVGAGLGSLSVSMIDFAKLIVGNFSLEGIVQAGIDLVGRLAAALAAGMKEIGSRMIGWAGDVVDGFVLGIKNKMNEAKQAVSNLVSKLKGTTTGDLEIHSPSRVFMEYGEYVSQGLAIGIDNKSYLAALSAQDLGLEVGQAAMGGLQQAFNGFVDNLFSGSLDMVASIKGLFSDLGREAVTSFSDMFKQAFSKGGGGFKDLFSGIMDGWKGVQKGFTSLFSGGGFGALGGALQGAMPIVGGLISGFNIIKGLIKSFSTKTVIGGGLNLGVEGGELIGNQYTRIKKTSWWGLRKKKYNKYSSLDGAFAEQMAESIDAIQKNAFDLFDTVGLDVSEAMIDGVDLAMKNINTHGLSEAQIQEKVGEFLDSYQNEIAGAFTGYSFDEVSTFANVQQILEPLGMQFDALQLVMSQSAETVEVSVASVGSMFGGLTKSILGWGGAVTTANETVVEGVHNVNSISIESANALAELAGGIEGLSGKVNNFIDKFFTDEEKLAVVTNSVNSVFEKLGLSVPATADAFKALVLSQDLTTEAGRSAYNALLDVANSMDIVFDAAQEAASAAAEALAQFNQDKSDILFDLLPEDQRLDAMRAQLETAFASIGEAVPTDLAAYRNILAAFDSTQGDVFYQLRDLVSVWEEVNAVSLEAAEAQAAALDRVRAKASSILDKSLDINYDMYASAHEAEMQAAIQRQKELENAGVSNDLLEEILAELRSQSASARDGERYS